MYIMMSVIPALFKGKGATAPAEGGNIPIAAGHASNMWGPNTAIVSCTKRLARRG